MLPRSDFCKQKSEQAIYSLLRRGAGGRGRTDTVLLPRDFESRAFQRGGKVDFPQCLSHFSRFYPEIIHTRANEPFLYRNFALRNKIQVSDFEDFSGVFRNRCPQ